LAHTIYHISEDAAFEAFDDGALILNLKNVTFTELNTTARDILQATDGKKDLQQVAAILAEEYEIDLDTALADVSELYQQLVEQGIVEIIAPLAEKEG
jgi:hypothetical protein